MRSGDVSTFGSISRFTILFLQLLLKTVQHAFILLSYLSSLLVYYPAVPNVLLYLFSSLCAKTETLFVTVEHSNFPVYGFVSRSCAHANL